MENSKKPTGEELLDAIGLIDDSFVEEAANPNRLNNQNKIRRFVPMMGSVAAAAVVLVVGIYSLGMFGGGGSSTSMMAEKSQSMDANLGETDADSVAEDFAVADINDEAADDEAPEELLGSTNSAGDAISTFTIDGYIVSIDENKIVIQVDGSSDDSIKLGSEITVNITDSSKIKDILDSFNDDDYIGVDVKVNDNGEYELVCINTEIED